MARRDRISTPGVRRADRWTALAGLALLGACVTTPPPAPRGEEAPTPAATVADSSPRDVLVRFLAAARAGDFEAAYGLLAGPWRARYTPARLAEDFAAVRSTAQDRLTRAELAAAGEPLVEGDRAEFTIGGASAVRLVRESGGWRVSALE